LDAASPKRRREGLNGLKSIGLEGVSMREWKYVQPRFAETVMIPLYSVPAALRRTIF
jgi:hypothetical protein